MGNCMGHDDKGGDVVVDGQKSQPEAKAIYLISIKTADGFCGAGTDRTVTIEIVGENGDTTGFLCLDTFFKNDFEKGQRDNFTIPAKDVGLPILINIKLQHGHADDEWLCNTIKVGIRGIITKVDFPIYDWIKNDMTILPGTASLPQQISNNLVKQARRRQIELSKELFEWVPKPTPKDIGWGLPRYVNAASYDDLPPQFKRSIIRAKYLQGAKLESGINLVVSLIENKFCPINSLEDYNNLNKLEQLSSDDPVYYKNWKEDATMGRQVLTGISPLVMEKCTCLPDYFNVTDEDVAGVLEGKTLKEEMDVGKLYISDYKPLTEHLKRNDGLHCTDSCGLFYVKNGEFLPIAIQLVPGDRDYLFIADGSDDWLLAKMYFRCTMGSIHEWVYHFLYTHNLTEPFAVALFRCFPKSHPLYKLLRPHLQTVSAINTDARTSLINASSLANTTIALSSVDTSRSFFSDFKFEDIVIPKRLKKQGLDDRENLPGFYYRDDALDLWKIMENFVRNLLGCYYKSNEDVQNDNELQDWMCDVSVNGLNWQENDTKKFPDKVETLDDLIEICVTLMFTCSAQHAAVNFGQFETYKFIPNSPSCMRLPPHKKGEGSLERILNTLPNPTQSALAIAITFSLSGYADDDVYIGQFPNNLFFDEDALNAQRTYTTELKEFEEKLQKRNEELGLELQYNFLVPGRVPVNIAI